jgi:hypothetical protein
MQKGILNQVPQLIEMFVVLALLLTIFSRWNLRFHPLLMCLLNNGITVIAFIGEQMICTDALNQLASMCAIRVGT